MFPPQDAPEDLLWAAFASSWFERALEASPELSARLEEQLGPAPEPARVRSLTYSNPLEIVLAVPGSIFGIGMLLIVARDWDAKRRIGKAHAEDYESRVKYKKRLRKHVVDQITSGELSVTPEQVNELLTDQTLDAIEAISLTSVEATADGERIA